MRGQAPPAAAARVPLQPARQVSAELVVSRAGLSYTSPALTALDLCESHGGDAIDEALQARATTLRNLHHALQLTSARLGNAER